MILNNIQLIRDQDYSDGTPISEAETFDLDRLYAGDSVHRICEEGEDANDMEKYCDFMQDLSDFNHLQSQIDRHIDSLLIEDGGFLKRA